MSTLIVSNFFREKARFLPVDFDVEGIPFELMPLTDDLIEKLKDGHTSGEVIKLAADWSLSYDNIRVIDNHKMTGYVLELWKDERIPESEPSVQEQVGLKSIEISGLSEFVNDMKDDEELAAMEAEEARVVDGDSEFNGQASLGDLHADKQLANA